VFASWRLGCSNDVGARRERELGATLDHADRSRASVGDAGAGEVAPRVDTNVAIEDGQGIADVTAATNSAIVQHDRDPVDERDGPGPRRRGALCPLSRDRLLAAPHVISLPAGTHVRLASVVTDMQCGMYGLTALVETALAANPYSTKPVLLLGPAS
jgi:hypothetical protein